MYSQSQSQSAGSSAQANVKKTLKNKTQKKFQKNQNRRSLWNAGQQKKKLHAHCPGRDRKEKKGRKERSFGKKIARFNHKENMNSHFNYYLTSKGQFRVSSQLLTNSVPVHVNKELKIKFLDRVSRYDWKISTTEFSVRLQMYSESDPPITVISEQFNSGDWDRSLPCLLESRDFTNFHRDVGMTLPEWTEFWKEHLPGSDREIKKVLDLSSKGKAYNNFNFKKLKLLFGKSWTFGTGQKVEKIKTEDIVVQTDVGGIDYDEEITNIIDTFVHVADEEMLTRAVKSWSEELEKKDQLLERESNLHGVLMSEDEIVEIAELLQDSDLFYKEKMEMAKLRATGMPSSITFFRYLEEAIELLSPGLSHTKLCEGTECSIEGICGRILSLCFGKKLYYSETAGFDSDEDIEGDSGEYSMSRDNITNVSHISLQMLQTSCDELEAAIISNSGQARRILVKSLEAQKKKLNQMYEKLEVKDPIEWNITRLRKLPLVYSILSEYNTFNGECGVDDFEDYNADEVFDVYRPVMMKKANKLYKDGDIDKGLLSDYKGTIKDNHTTTLFVQLFSLCLRSSLIFKHDGITYYEQPYIPSEEDIEDEDFTHWLIEVNDPVDQTSEPVIKLEEIV